MIKPNYFSNCKWPIKPLGQVVEFLDNLRKPVKESDRKPGPYPYYGANGQQGTIDSFLFNEDLILLAEDGGFFGQVGKTIAYQISGKAWVNNHAHVLRPQKCADIRFLCRQLESYDVTPFINGTTRGKLTKGASERIPIILPPLSEQKRIATILDKADSIRRKRRMMVELTEELLHSVFLYMFGDPISNPKDWPIFEGGSVFDRLDYGTSQKCYGKQEIESLPVLRIPNVVGGQISLQDLKFALLSVNEREKCLLNEGDILFVRTNGNPENIGRCAVFQGKQKVLFASYLIRGRLKSKSNFRPLFLKELFSFPTFRKQFVAAARTTAGNYNISAERIRGLRVISPPTDLQEKFEIVINKIWKLRAKVIEAQNETAALFNALLQRAFQGEL